MKDIATPFGKLSFIFEVNAQGTEATLTVDPLSDPSCKGIFVHLGEWGTADGANASVLKADAKKSNSILIKLIHQ
jgi:hypothetical protein